MCYTFLSRLKYYHQPRLEIIERMCLSFSQLIGQYDVVVNCTGLRSRTLFKDDKVFPTRGHLLRVCTLKLGVY